MYFQNICLENCEEMFPLEGGEFISLAKPISHEETKNTNSP